MKTTKIYILFSAFCVWLLFSPQCIDNIQGTNFVVVIDAGHGGHDPGAVGRMSKEKDINLSVALKFGNLIKNNCNDVKVVYTRSRDVFIPLDKRADIANDAKADLFISIHTNALAQNRTATGASTWTLGLAKSNANLDVAKRENSVILYESDYKKRYAGFNPNSAESYIIFEFMQDKYMEQSVHLASLVQKQFGTNCGRPNRGVHQAGFLVLKASAMPSILVELGFISTPEEERFLNTEEGTSTMAKGIFNAFINYKKEKEIRLTGKSQTNASEETIANTDVTPLEKTEVINSDTANRENKGSIDQIFTDEKVEVSLPKENLVNSAFSKSKQLKSDDIIFKVQFTTSTKELSPKNSRFKGLENVEYYKENGIYKFTSGSSSNYNETLRIQKKISLLFKDAFIIAFCNGEKMNINEAIRKFKQNQK